AVLVRRLPGGGAGAAVLPGGSARPGCRTPRGGSDRDHGGAGAGGHGAAGGRGGEAPPADGVRLSGPCGNDAESRGGTLWVQTRPAGTLWVQTRGLVHFRCKSARLVHFGCKRVACFG